jgi:two-component system catabolic regulation response regulator CreB
VKPRVLLVEDEKAVAETIVYALRSDGCEVTWLTTGGEALAHLRDPGADLLVLDVGLPDGSGLDLLRELRHAPSGLRTAAQTPVLMLSAQGEEIDRVLGLELGADDYLPKPFSPRELAARAKALLRRSQLPRTTHSAPTGQGLEHDEAGQRILLHGQALALTRREYLLLAQLLAGAGRIHTREALLAAAWGDDSDSQDRTVDTHIKTLRAKLRELDPTRDYIRTHRGMGYCLDV